MKIRWSFWLRVVFGIVVFAAILLTGGILWLRSYLLGEGFRSQMDRSTSAILKADGKYLPFRFSGTKIYSDGFYATGTPESFFFEARADQLRADLDLSGVLDRIWEVDLLQIGKLTMSLGEEKRVLPPHQESPAIRYTKSKQWKWLPDRVQVNKGVVQDANLLWQYNGVPGGLKNASVNFEPKENGWKIHVQNGRVTHADKWDLNLKSSEMDYRRSHLYITRAEFTGDAASRLELHGEADFEKAAVLFLEFGGFPLHSWLSEDWRYKLTGNLEGEMKIETSLPRQNWNGGGDLKLTGGQLQGLPVLNQIALFTQTEQFRTLPLNKASMHLSFAETKWEGRNVIIESEGKLKMEGNFVVENDQISGEFQIGIGVPFLQWLPENKIFTASRDGYLWTPVKIYGPVSNPSDDLTPRLLQGVQETVIETIKQGQEEIQQGIINLMDPLFGK